MDRRSFIESCTATAACISAAAILPARAHDAKPRAYSRSLLVDSQGEPVRLSALLAQTNYVFHYPYEATPAFLLNLGKRVTPQSLTTRGHDAYVWPGGVGPQRAVVAYSAICTHQLAYPTRDESFISFRKTRAIKGVQDELIHCCADHSQFDPAHGAQVMSGPAPQPLCTVLLEHDAKADTLTAWGTLGGEMFDEFFRKYEARLTQDAGPAAKNPVGAHTVVSELEKFCRNAVRC